MSDKKPLVLYGADIKELASTDTIPVVNGGVDQAAWTTFTPTFTGITVGNGVVVTKYKQIGKTVFARIELTCGTTTTTSGAAQSITLPVTSSARNASSIMGLGAGYATSYFLLVPLYKSTTDFWITFQSTAGGINPTLVSSTLGWTNGWSFSFDLTYEVA